MGTACKKPSRANTARAAEFVANVLVHIHSDMNVILKDPSVIPEINDALSGRADRLVSRYEFDRTHHNVKVYLSSCKLKKAFGKPAETIWRKLFVRLNPGGRSLSTGQRYDSCWVLNREAERCFLFSKQRYMAARGITPEQLLRALEEIPEQLVAPTAYVAAVVDEELGLKRVLGRDKRVMRREQHRVVLQESQGLRAEVRAHNLLVSEGARASASQLDGQASAEVAQ